VERRLDRGEREKAKAFLSETEIPPRELTQIAWVCQKKGAYDLSFELFKKRIDCLDFKGLAAFEKAAQKCGRLEEVIQNYGLLAPQNKKFYGRIAKLTKRVEG